MSQSFKELKNKYLEFHKNSTYKIPPKQHSLRFITYNVHYFSDVNGVNNAIDIINVILSLDADIIALQELWFSCRTISYQDFKNILRNNNYNYYRLESRGPNALISKYKLNNIQKLNIGSSGVKSHKIVRNAILADIKFNEKIIGIAATHLDVYDETEMTRLSQINQIIKALEIRDNDKCLNIIMGDLNSVRSNDYEPFRWQEIINEDLDRGVDTQTLVMNNLNKYKYKDVFDLNTIEQPKPQNTVWSCRRVDYIMVKKNNNNYSQIKAYISHHTESDHVPVVADITI